MAEAKRLNWDDVDARAAAIARRVRDDATPEERAERELFEQRRRAFEALAGRVRGLNASERNAAVQAATAETFERQWRLGAKTRAHERGVPSRDDVRRVALLAEPPEGDALTAVRSFLGWRAQLSVALRGARVPGVQVLLSPAGGGKSSALGWAVTWHRESALYTTAAHVAANPLTAHSQSHAAWAQLLAPDLLAVDEIGREGDRAAAVMALVLERDGRGRATVLAGNRSEAEFLERYVLPDEAIASRFEQQQRRGFGPVTAWAGNDLRAAGEGGE